MLTLSLMSMRTVWRIVFLLILSGCAASTVPEAKPPPDTSAWAPEPPFARDQKIEIPAESVGLFHFLKGQLLLGQGEFDEALKEFEAAAQANPGDSFLHFRLATLYLRKGDLKKAVAEAEIAVRTDPKGVDNHLLLAGLYSSLGFSEGFVSMGKDL